MAPQEQGSSSGIKWHEVTWYSRLLALVLFLGVIPGLSIYIGSQYQLLHDEQIMLWPKVDLAQQNYEITQPGVKGPTEPEVTHYGNGFPDSYIDVTHVGFINNDFEVVKVDGIVHSDNGHTANFNKLLTVGNGIAMTADYGRKGEYCDMSFIFIADTVTIKANDDEACSKVWGWETGAYFEGTFNKKPDPSTATSSSSSKSSGVSDAGKLPSDDFRWNFMNAPEDTSRGNIPQTKVTLSYRGGTPRVVGTYHGTCQTNMGKGYPESAQDVEEVLCWYAGGGNRIAVFDAGTKYIIKQGLTGEDSPDGPITETWGTNLFELAK